MPSTLSIIIVSWNTRSLLLNCLESVYQNLSADEGEVWVVDNASSDGSPAAVRQHFPYAQVIVNTENKGFAQANNQALERASGRYVLLLNADTVLKPGAIPQLLTFMEQHPQVGGAGPALFNPDGTLQESCYPFPNLGRELWRLLHLDTLHAYGKYDMARWNPALPRPVDTVQGACLILRRAALDQVGLLDPRFFVYTEEVDLCYRLKKAGWPLCWVPQAQVIHYGGQSTSQAAPTMFLTLYQTKVQFFRKHYGWFGAAAYKLILFVASLARLLFSPLAWLQKPPHRTRNLYLARRYVDLLANLARL